MAHQMLRNTSLFIVVFLYAMHGCESRNFPLDGCSTDNLDILFLYFESRSDSRYTRQKEESALFVQDLLSFSSNKTTPRVMVADVYDRFSALDPHVNVSSWQLQPSLQPQAYGVTEQQARIQGHFKLQEVIEQKVAFTQRLFSEMGGVRENVIHVAVIFLEIVGFSYEESRSVPRIVQQQGTDIKIFVVVLGEARYTRETVHLSDTLVGTYLRLPNRALTMAICNQCMEGGIMFKHNVGAHYLSCYFCVKFDKTVSSFNGVHACYRNKYGGFAAIENYEELDFLKKTLSTYFKKLGNQINDYNVSSVASAHVYISLERDHFSVAKRFQWYVYKPQGYSPLVVNNWLPGKPAGGYNIKRGAWQFVWDTHVNMTATNISGSDDRFVEGWVDVDGRAELGLFSLCETVLPKRVEEQPFIIIKPATNKSFSQVLNKQGFMKFGDNIVSIAANIASLDFRTFLQELKGEFPMFDCGVDAYDSRYISYLYVCDSIVHCSNRNDENFCFTKSQSNVEMYMKNCYGVHCCDGLCLPLQWVNDGEVDCTICDSTGGNVFNDERDVLNKYLKRNETCAFICNDNKCVHFSQLNDGVRDCTGPEGPLDETIGKLERATTCYNILGHSIWAPRCVYVKDRFSAILGCRDLSHLKNCADFECPEGYVQCPNTYCIPQHYVLDGKADCPTGEDELPDIIGPCTGNFACWNSKMCLHTDLVCDGHPDCPHRDDEVDCDGSCAEGFSCMSGTITVTYYNRSISLIDNDNVIYYKARYLDISGLDLPQLLNLYELFSKEIRFFKCSSCKIRYFCNLFLYYSNNLIEVDVSYNQIQELDGGEFENPTFDQLRSLNMSYNRELYDVRRLRFKFLETLDLSHTALSRVDESNFEGLKNLKHLDLSFTSIRSFHGNSLPTNVVLQTLDLRGLLMDNFYENFFNGLTISHDLYTDSFQLCCPQIRGTNIPYHTCHAPDDAISSCFDLVGVNVQRVFLWVVAVLAVLGNMTVIVYRVIWDRSVLRTSYGMFVTNLGISDFSMGVYLFIFAGADYYYRGIYVLYDKSWRESSVCRLAGFLATLSSETSTFFVLLITADRFLVMKFPFGQIRFSEISTIVALLLSWIIGFSLALMPVVFRFEIYSSTAMCLGLSLTTTRLSGWEFSFGMFIVLKLLTCLVIAYGQRAIFRAMSENRITGTESSSSPRRVEDVMVAKQLSLVALSNCLCWFPISVMGLLSLGGHEISNDVYAWTTVLVLPINSAANPLIYTIPALMVKWEKFKSSGRK